jgi:TadE-like protein
MVRLRDLPGGLIGLFKDERGAALLEFAISLPLLVVFVVGIYDFSGALNQKQKIEQAAQEGAIIAGAQPMSDIASSNANPTSLQPVVTAVFNSLVGSQVIRGCALPAPAPAHPGGLTWTYTITGCPGSLGIVINRGLVIAGTGGSPSSVGTAVQVSYPYQWQFNSVIQLLIPGATYAATTSLSETATVHNQL